MFRIKKLDIFIAKQFGMLFMGTFFISLFVLMMQFLWRYVDDLIGKGLSMDVLGQFFWYMSLMMVPQALPLAILLSSLISYGNLGESSELTAIKAAGISLIQSFRGLIVISIFIAFGSFYFQNNVGPIAHKHIAQLLISMKQKSPELEIPEGIFYDGIPQTNLYTYIFSNLLPQASGSEKGRDGSRHGTHHGGRQPDAVQLQVECRSEAVGHQRGTCHGQKRGGTRNEPYA